MSRPAVITVVDGKPYTMSELARVFKLNWRTVKRWRAQGKLTEQRIKQYLRDREDRRDLLRIARANGITDGARRMRLSRGWTDRQAVTAPMVAQGRMT